MKHNSFTPISRIKKVDTINILAITSTWIAMVILVNPIGDFPLNDDWAYGWAVKSLLEKGNFQLSGWTATNLFSQVFWGALFCLPFGFSFTALRFSTLTLGLVGVLATYGLLRELNSNPRLSLFGALIAAINPIYFGLSNTFMNDVPFCAFAISSLYFLVRGLKKGSKIEVSIGIIITCVAILSRQSGLAIPLAFGCAYLVKEGTNFANFVKGFFPALIGVGVQLFYQRWLQVTERLPASYGNQVKTLFKEFSQGVIHQSANFTTITLVSLIYLGLFILPFLIVLFFIKFKKSSSQQRGMILIASSALFIVVINILMTKLLTQQRTMPLVGNILTDFGLGPMGLSNSSIPKAPRIIWLIITLIGVVGAVLLIQYIFAAVVQLFNRYSRNELLDRKWLTTLVLSAAFIYFLPLGFLGLSAFGFYDRYLIFLIPLLMMTIAISTENISSWDVNYRCTFIALLLMLFYGGFTIGATHDYLSWNRSRWLALDNLTQELHISPRQIDGGMEFNGWFLYNPQYKYKTDKNWYWVENDDYLVSFNPLPGYEQVKQYSFNRWMPFGQGNVLVLHRNNN